MYEMQEEIVVSVFMLAYNHEEFIEQAIESVLCQKTNFKYEIIIGEDCSQDKTREICLKYHKNYPGKIKLILHKKNVGIYENMKSVYDTCTGKYIAHLECDDYWNDDKKLQKQVDFMELHKEYSAVVHNSYMLDYKTGRKKILSNRHKDYDIKMKEVIGWNNVFQTSALFARGEVCKNRPFFAQGVSGIGDYPTALWLRLNGKIRFIGDIMSTYRFNTPGSWSSKNITNEQIKYNENKVKNMLGLFNEYTHHEYDKFIMKRIDKIEIGRCVRESDKKALKKVGGRRILSVCGVKGTAGVLFGLLLNKLSK